MDLFECQDFFKAQNPGKSIAFEFDEKCHRKLEFIITDGSPNVTHHIECNKVKVTVEGNTPTYVPIVTHRLNVLWADLRDFIVGKLDVWFHPDDLENLSTLQEDDYKNKMQEFIKATGLSKAAIEKKILDYKKSKETT